MILERRTLALVLLLVSTGVVALPAAGADPLVAARCATGPARRPLIFEPAAAGATHRFVAHARDYDALLGADEIVVRPRAAGGRDPLRLRFLGASPGAAVLGKDALPGKSHYYLGADPALWRRDVPHYARVAAEGIYPGIDVVYYGRDREIEFDFIVAPGADPARVRIGIAAEPEAALDAAVDAAGDLAIRGDDGECILRRPHVYQDAGGFRRTIPARYVVESLHPLRVGFELSDYDADRPLVIDPVLSYAGRYGGNGLDAFEDLAVDRAGDVYVTGWTQSTSFSAPAGESPLLIGAGGNGDAFVLKLSGDGSTVLYSTFLGGVSLDQGFGIDVDDDGNAYVAGGTSWLETGFPSTPGAYRTVPADFFVAKLGPQGELLYSTFIGGLNIGSFGGLAVHGSGDGARVAIVGSTVSGHPTTANAYRRGVRGTSDLFLSILEPAAEPPASQLVYSTFFGAGVSDSGLAVAMGPSGRAYVAGSTQGADLPVRRGFDDTYAGPGRDAFVAVFDPTRSGDESLVYSSYIGGRLDENGTARHGGIAVDASGVALVTGSTNSTDFSVTPEGFRVSRLSSDAFLVVVDPSLPGRDSLLYGTYLGGSGADAGTDVAAGPPGIAYVAGYTLSADIPGGDGAVAVKYGAGALGAGQDTFVAKIDWRRTAGESLIDAAIIGGTGGDFAMAVAADAFDVVHVAGSTSSDNGFVPDRGLGAQDGFVAGIATVIQLADGVVARPSIDVLSADFGTAPHAWAVVSGAPPPGLALSADGTLSGEPTEAGSATFTVEIADALGATRRRTYRKLIGTGAAPGDVLLRKAGVTPALGRVLTYHILLRNRSDRTLRDVGVVELLEPWFVYLSSSPPPTLLEPRPGNVYWTIPRMDPGQLETISYSVAIPADFPTGVIVRGEACLTEDDCNKERAECEADAREFCENTLCVGNGSGPQCIGCNQDEAERCRANWMHCMGLVGMGTSETPEEGTEGGGCHTHSGPTDRPIDPNEKGVSSGPFIPAGEILGYTIHFENVGTIEAKDVFLVDVLDEDLDLSTVQVKRRLGGLMPLAADTTLSIFEDDAEDAERWTVTLDSATRTISWELLDIDLPAGATDSVFFVIQAPEDLESGTEIRNDATIQFEVFETLTTNETVNVVDETPPVGTVEPLPAVTFTEEFTVSWSGTDEVGAIEQFIIYVSTNDGPFLQLVRTPAPGSLVFTGAAGNAYGFLCIARDTAGNIETLDGVAETVTAVELPPLPSFHRGDPNGSGDVDVSDAIRVFSHLFLGDPAALSCRESADANNDGALDISDGIYLLRWLFAGGPEPAEPGPPGTPCGPDPDPPGAAGDLGCEEYAPCGGG